MITNIDRERNYFQQELNSHYESRRNMIAEELGKRENEVLNNEVHFENGVARWASNNRCVPMDIAVQFEYLEQPIDLQKHEAAADSEMTAFFKKYKAQRANERMDEAARAEHEFELRAAYGEGTVVMDLATGERTIL